MIYTKTITLNSFVGEKGYLRETDFPFYLEIHRLTTTNSITAFSKQISIVKNNENRESLRNVELLKWLLCDDLFYLVFNQCFDVTGKLKKYPKEGIESSVNYPQIMSPILNKNKRRPTTVNLLNKVTDYILKSPTVLSKQFDYIKSNIETSEFYTSIYAADKSYYDYLVMEKIINQGKLADNEQSAIIMRLLKTSYDDKYHGNNNVVKGTLCRSLGWDIPNNKATELLFYKRLTALIIESITQEIDELNNKLEEFIGLDTVKNIDGYNRWDHEKPFTELHNTIQHILMYHGDLYRVSNGFLTVQFYKYLFNHVKRRLYIVTPSNDNLFNPETIENFKNMVSRSGSNQIDFRCLYSSPDKSNKFLDLVDEADLLRQQINVNLEIAKSCFKSINYDPSKHVRLFARMYDRLMIVLDDVILYRNPYENGKTFMNTVNESFYVIHADSKGAFFALEDFINHWEHFSKPIE